MHGTPACARCGAEHQRLQYQRLWHHWRWDAGSQGLFPSRAYRRFIITLFTEGRLEPGTPANVGIAPRLGCPVARAANRVTEYKRKQRLCTARPRLVRSWPNASRLATDRHGSQRLATDHSVH